ncbi:MAG: type II toxin-antitoxin system HicA family toxin [Candidatus Riflebacteria bacterium]|nr:type II toxin-antitoxin system HicA family toxin [Candidatus Riflebacteria bacterium]
MSLLGSLSSRQVLQALAAAGFVPAPKRGKGSHVALVRVDAGGQVRLVIVPQNRDLPAGTLHSILQQAGSELLTCRWHMLTRAYIALACARIRPGSMHELSLEVRRAELAREIAWVPAVENRGEGVFLSFRRDALEAWKERPEVKARFDRPLAGFTAWQQAHPGSKARFPGLPYILLHSLSHLLITAVALECGYAASSIRERIYAGDSGHGILLYTGTPDSEGTLGGLVQVGRRIETHLRRALEVERLCSNDPVCAQHWADSREEHRFLHGAACHGCLLIAETCCERRNEFLDRALGVWTVDEGGAEYFRGDFP